MPKQEDSLKKRYVIKLFSNLIASVVNIAIITILPKALGVSGFGQFILLSHRKKKPKKI